MDINYGNGSVSIKNIPSGRTTFTIFYKGNIYISKKVNCLHLKNQIQFNFNNNNLSELELFRYVGFFKIYKVVPNKKIPVNIKFLGLNLINKIETPIENIDTKIEKITSSYIYGRTIRRIQKNAL